MRIGGRCQKFGRERRSRYSYAWHLRSWRALRRPVLERSHCSRQRPTSSAEERREKVKALPFSGAPSFANGGKPNSVPPRFPVDSTIISLTPLARRVPLARDATITRELPRFREAGQAPAPCYVLHHMGFFVPRHLRAGRWALTPPFHPDPAPALRPKRGGLIFCDTFRRAGLSPRAPAHSARHVAWWCSDFPLRRPKPAQRSSAIREEGAPVLGVWQVFDQCERGVMRAGGGRSAVDLCHCLHTPSRFNKRQSREFLPIRCLTFHLDDPRGARRLVVRWLPAVRSTDADRSEIDSGQSRGIGWRNYRSGGAFPRRVWTD